MAQSNGDTGETPQHGSGCQVGSEGAAMGATLSPALYAQLRRIALAYMGQERREHTLSATALVHEAWMKMTPCDPLDSKSLLLAAYARAMRQILVDHARARGRRKRGGGWGRVSFSGLQADARDTEIELLDLDQALGELELLDSHHGRIMELKLYGQATNRQIAEVLGCSLRTVESNLSMARVWLRRRLVTEA